VCPFIKHMVGQFKTKSLARIYCKMAALCIMFIGLAVHSAKSKPEWKILGPVPRVTIQRGPSVFETMSSASLIFYIDLKSNVLSGLFSTKKKISPSLMSPIDLSS